MLTKIISAFPGTGKTFYHNNHKETTLDSDSSNFSWLYLNDHKIRNPEFPNNYINHIKENIGKYDYIFVSSHKEVRQALKDSFLFFYLVYPNINDKQIYIQRYIDRNSPKPFITLIENNWENWIKECINEGINETNCANLQLESNQTINDFINNF